MTHFGPIFPILGTKKIFLKNQALSRTTTHGILAPCQISEKTNDTIPRKRLDRRIDGKVDGRKDGWTPLHRTLPVTAGRPINMATSQTHFKWTDGKLINLEKYSQEFKSYM